ncbi:hypothetical protein JMJ55_04580 [Belnapia sp. T6]|uniref:Uncharacterized protein n=1 Tax=Belnapia mucosa TaxID=2804532 RepID=A0ABS1UYP8_9PROT|nr:hypothetical protein [Belnapia mucosa]MBL6454589.1 hypothetical protein [Belnapia mucosa]
MASLVRVRPSLVSRLILAPREAVHAVGAFLHLAPDALRPDVEVAEVIDGSDPRKLLRAALPNCPARLYRALDTAGERVLSRRFYERLGQICRGPFADALLDDDLTTDRIAYYETLSEMDPATAALRTAIRENSYVLDSVNCMMSLLRAHGVLRDEDMRLPSGAGMPAVARRIRMALARIAVPDPGFAVPEPFRLVRTTDELQRIARSFQNCVALPDWGAAKYHVNLVRGLTVLLVSDDPPLLAALHRVADGVWQFEQCAGPKNAYPPLGAKSALIRGLRAAGLTIVETDPQSALARIEQGAKRGRDLDVGLDDNDDDGDDEDGEDEIAA